MTLHASRRRCLSIRIFQVAALAWLLLWLGEPGNAGAPQDPVKAPPLVKSQDKDKAPPASKDAQPPKTATPKLGLALNDPKKAYQGYTLLGSLMSTKIYLIDMQGKVVRTWDAKCHPAASVYLLENGHLLRTGSLMGEERSFQGGPAAGGRVLEFNWEGELVWDFRLFTEKQLPHHDITKMPNGNVLMIVWDKKTAKEALAAGRRPELTGDSHLLPDSLIEIKPTGTKTGEVVWEWHLWDHLVQDYDKSKANYGNVAEHPELVNINYGEDALAPIKNTKAGADKLKSLGYVGATPAGTKPRVNPDWTHFNCVAYNPELDQVVVSVHGFSEFWIIDHSTTTSEAASHSGGKSGKGGDLLYRYGNPRAYRAGTKADQKLFAQHNAHWIPPGLPGEGHLLVYNNGAGRPDGSYSSVDELVLPVDADGHYAYQTGAAYGPDKPVWSYTAPKKTDFFSSFISGAQRLPNGNTLICSGANGTIFEVTPEKEIVWKYLNPVKNTPGGGPGGPPGLPQAGQVLLSFHQDMLKLSADQKKQLEAMQKDVDKKLDGTLTEAQKKQLKERNAGFALPGQFLATSSRDALKPTSDQKKQLEELQKDVDGRLEKLLTEDQRKQLKKMRDDMGRGGQQTFVIAGPGGGPGAGPIFVPGGPGGFGQPARAGQVLPGFLHDMLKLSDDQKKQAAEIQKEIDVQLEKTLTAEQRKQLAEPPAGGPGGFRTMPDPGQIMSPTMQASLKLTAEQKKQVADLQKQTDDKLGKLLSDDQKKQLKETKANFARGGGFPGGGPGPMPGFGPPGGSSIFRAYRFGRDYPGLAGKDLTAGKSIEELQTAEEPKKK
jgi:hypothetical protein